MRIRTIRDDPCPTTEDRPKESPIETTPPDEALIRRTLAGETDAYGVLVDRYADFVYGVAYGILGHREDALEMTQTVFVRSLERLAKLREPARFKSWLGMIASTQSRNRRRDRRETPVAEIPEDVAPERAPLERLIDAEEQRQLADALATLPEKNRVVIVLRYQTGHGYQDISDALDIPVTTVRSRLHEGKRMLRERLDAEETSDA